MYRQLLTFQILYFCPHNSRCISECIVLEPNVVRVTVVSVLCVNMVGYVGEERGVFEGLVRNLKVLDHFKYLPY
jgi:hypothetical protein